ncbi:uncharacterized protein LOC143619430 [Bidens hawaiensis]|uniref:uncharacterized protein LOC143619430 n=1 Tax=Bidens hawaiensis TaxID=980011 RepID=UPI0040493B4A
MGDFNAVRFPEERRNSVFDPTCARDLNEFIAEADLFEFPMKGQQFTFCKSRGRKFSKIDRILVNQDFVDNWSDSSFSALPRYLSDHSPIILISDPLDFGPCPFKVFNSWMDSSEFEKVVIEACSDFVFVGPPDVFLAEKFKYIKFQLKQWARVRVVNDNERFEELKNELSIMDSLLEERPLLEEKDWVRTECLLELSVLENQKTKDIQQKARAKWASFGDDNLAYFHRVIKHRNISNKINGLEINGRWCSIPNRVKKEVLSHFWNRFNEPIINRPKMYNRGFHRLSVEQADALVTHFSASEIKVAVWECGDNKAPGPDGLNFKFIKKF